jgi:aminopeptidase S
VKRRRLGILAALGGLLLLATEPRAEQTSSIRDVTAAIAKGADSAGRRQAIVDRLKAIGVEYKLQEFTTRKGQAGTNIVATVKGGPAGVVLIGAHYDRVSVGQGVLDNGASCAVLVEVLDALKRREMRNYTVRAVFFDLEEVGLDGSQAFFDLASAASQPKPAFAINLDIFGYGNSFFATASPPEGRLARSLSRAAQASGVAVRFADSAHYPLSDHHNMIAAGIETLGIALIDGAEVDAIMSGGQGPPPRVLTILHTPKDAIEVLNVAEVATGTLGIERLMRIVDSGS